MSIASEITRLTSLRDRLRTKLRSWSVLFSQSADLEDCVDFLENAVTTKSATTYTPTTVDQTIAPGTYIADTQTILGDVNLVSANIVSGVSIFGVPGAAGGGGSSGLEYETGTWTPTSDIARGTISFSNSHTLPPMFVMVSDATGTIDTTTNTNMAFAFCDYYRLTGVGFPYSSSVFRYAGAYWIYRSTSTTSVTTGGGSIANNSDNTTASSSSYSRYWVTPTEIYPYTNATSRYWRASRTYKWIAVWAPTT